jgi:Phage Terminase
MLQSWGAASWTDPEVWRKANPNFGLSVKADDLARKAEKAIALPGAQNAFRRMHLNEWTEQAERWIDLATWDACAGPVDLEALRGRAATAIRLAPADAKPWGVHHMVATNRSQHPSEGGVAVPPIVGKSRQRTPGGLVHLSRG